jgi:hypothetical protein
MRDVAFLKEKSWSIAIFTDACQGWVSVVITFTVSGYGTLDAITCRGERRNTAIDMLPVLITDHSLVLPSLG